jgi:D-xylonolactonase
MNQTELEIVAQDNNRCGEAPIWDAALHRLIWTDISSDLVYELSPTNGKKQVLSRGLNVSGIALGRTGALVFAGAGGIHCWRRQDEYRTIVSQHQTESLLFNDIIADPLGRIYAGTLYWGSAGMEKPGKLYLIDCAGQIVIVDEGIQLANGLGLSTDNRTLYFADSAARCIYAYAVDPQSGALSRRRTFVSVPVDDGIPDGITVDGQDYVWCAMWYGGQVIRYDPDGRIERRIALPVKQVSSIAFGGEALTDLYITTAGEAWPSALAPPGLRFDTAEMGGSLYRLRLDIPGKPEHRANLVFSS